MAQREILVDPDPRLRAIAEPVRDFDADLNQRVDDLFDTLYGTSSAIGLSAPQLGDASQILVMDLSGDRSDPHVYINPRITARARFGFVEESCLSVPDQLVNVWRATQVRVVAQDRTGQPIERELDRLAAVCLQHEMDHFRGKLLVDRMSFIRRYRYRRTHAVPA